MTNLNLVANELTNAGFKVAKRNNSLIVGLDTRRVNNMEVREVLAERFEDIRFSLSSFGQEIEVKE